MSDKSDTTRNFLAIIGLIALVMKSVEFFQKHIQDPLERKLTDLYDQETGFVRAERAAQADAAAARAEAAARGTTSS